MGTRNMIVVFKDGEYKFAKYCQWDGYFSGQGSDLVDILAIQDQQAFFDGLSRCYEVTEEDRHEMYLRVGHDLNASNGLIDWDTAKQFGKMFPLLYRDMGAESISYIENSKENRIPINNIENSMEFLGDSLFCEYAYVIDYDKNILEVYTGFNKSPLTETERFYSMKLEGEYYPVRHLISFDLDNLPTSKEFVAICEDLEEKERIMTDYTIVFNEDETVTISYEMFSNLLDESRFLSALQALGVDNWQSYDEAKELLEEWDQLDQLAETIEEEQL